MRPAAIKYYLACLFFLLALKPAGAGMNLSWVSRIWQTEDGLPEQNIVDMVQTGEGYLWIATNEGLFRFDGVRFQELDLGMKPGQSPARIRHILMDRHGRLWIVRDFGSVLCVENGTLVRSFNLGELSFSQQAYSIAEDADGNIWVTDSNGVAFEIHGGKPRVFGKHPDQNPGETCLLASDASGQIWFSQGGSVGLLRNGHFETLFKNGDKTASIAKARDGGVWLCAGLNLFKCRKGAELEIVSTLKLEPGDAVADTSELYEDRTGGLWIGTGTGGLYRYDSKGIENLKTALPAITAIAQDFEGDIWVSTRGGGLNRFRPRADEWVGKGSGLPFVAVHSACEDTNGTLWVAGQNGAFAFQTNDQWQLVTTNDGWNGGWVTSITTNFAGGLFIGTRNQGVFTGQNGIFSPFLTNKPVMDSAVRSLYASPQGDLWIGANSGSVLRRYRGDKLTTFPLPEGCLNVRSMISDSHSNLWAGTVEGKLLRVEGNRLRDETALLTSASIHSIRCLQITDEDCLWIGFAGQGLGRLKNGRYMEFHSREGLWDEYISQILPDDRGWLWLAGNRGICHVTLTELNNLAEGNGGTQMRPVTMGRGDGLPTLRAAFGSWPTSFHCRDGRQLMPMQTGLVIIQPGQVRSNRIPPPVVIESVKVNGKPVAVYDILQPDPDNNSSSHPPVNLHTRPGVVQVAPGVKQMEFEFTALSLSAPDEVTLRYQLEGIDADWVPAGKFRMARYSPMAPGSYRFRVTACNKEGVWNENGDSLDLMVLPQFLEKAWFRIMATICTLVLLSTTVVMAVQNRYRGKLKLLEQRQALDRERTRIAQDLHDDLGAGLVEINFGSELARDPALPPEEMREHAREIGARAREMVTALDEIVWAVNPKHDSVSSLATYFCQFAQHFLKATSVRCHLDVARDFPAAPLNAEERHNLFLAFKEALCNAVQHSGAKDLRITIAVVNRVLTVAVNDNGRGLDASTQQGRPGADGLSNMFRRLEQLGGHCELVSTPDGGTTVTFKVPLRNGEVAKHA